MGATGTEVIETEKDLTALIAGKDAMVTEAIETKSQKEASAESRRTAVADQETVAVRQNLYVVWPA